MWGLLLKACREIVNRPIALLKCFWLAVVLRCAVLSLLLYGVITDVEAAVLSIVIICVAVSPGAVLWHRHVISQHKLSWTPYIPSLPSLSYAGKILVTLFAFAVLGKIFEAFMRDLVMPVYWVTMGGNAQAPSELLFWLVTDVLTLLSFALIFGTWMLRLPEGSLDLPARGFRNQWPAGGKSEYRLALILVYLVPPLACFIVLWLEQTDRIWWSMLIVAAQIVSLLLVLSLLTVTYRRNLEHAGVTAG
jgi:hypothetical protein